MRKTEESELHFHNASRSAYRMNSDETISIDLRTYRQWTSEGMEKLAASIRDIYDKLEAIHADIRARNPQR
jgi:hypothetical protein